MDFQKGGLQLLQRDIRILLNQLRKEVLVGHETAMPPAPRVGFGAEVTGPPQAVCEPHGGCRRNQ